MEKLKIISWNVNGLRALSQKISDNKRTFLGLFQEWDADVICFQETKVDSIQNVDERIAHVEGFESFWSFCAMKKGYSGVAIYAKKGLVHNVVNSFGVDKFDIEGRTIRVDLSNLVLFCVYFPNAGRGPERLAYKLEFYRWFQGVCEELTKSGRSVVVVGDVNTTHTALDIHTGDNSPFTAAETDWISNFIQAGFVDTFRYKHPGVVRFSWWDPKTNQRVVNNGYRLDYCFVSKDLTDRVLESDMLTLQGGSDHCPVFLTLDTKGIEPIITTQTHALSSDKIKKKQPKLLSFFSHVTSPPAAAVGVILPQTTSPKAPPSLGDPDDDPTATRTKKRKLTDFFIAQPNKKPSL